MNFLRIQDFKCFIDIEIPINQLTVMAGANGAGKSSSIQSLLYLRRTIEHCGEWKNGKYEIEKINGMNVPLNDVYCLALGNSSVVLNQQSTDDKLTIGLSDENDGISITYRADNREPKLFLTPDEPQKTGNYSSPIFEQEFYYLNAERTGPRSSHALQFYDYPNTGWKGELTGQILGLGEGYFKIEENRNFPNTKSSYISDQVNNWLNFIMPGVRVKAKNDMNTLTSQILLQNQYTSSDYTMATNLGFGISYILPIIVTGLIAKKGSFMIVENPEAHLHPAAQSKIGQFLAIIASCGVNVIVETHSDHFINGIQIGVAQNSINPNLVTINFFSEIEKDNQPEVNPISTNKKGELSDWPKGFFDQTQIDYAQLINLRRR
jgi:predicted ATPase